MTISEENLGLFPIRLERDVAWGEMDAYRHVNNTVYLRWFETARIAYFEAVQVVGGSMNPDIAPILARATCDYRIPVTYPDRVTIEATTAKLGTRSFTMEYRVRSHAHGLEIAAEGEGIVVLFDYAAKETVPLPTDLRSQILSVEASSRD